MTKKSIFTVIGARPQFIKAAAVSRLISRHEGLEEILVHTGQHYDGNMSQIFFDELEIPVPNVNLGVGSGGHGEQTGQMLSAIEKELLKHKPDCLLVYGDTNSTLAGALAAAKLHIPVAHVEAGLRSFNRNMPEEINRVMADHLSEWLFTPTNEAVSNLATEGILGDKVIESGDVMYDAALYFGHKAESESRILDDLGLKAGEYILSTVHRAENTDDPVRLEAIMQGLGLASQTCPVILPLHPRTTAVLKRQGITFSDNSNVRVIDPVGYLDMVMLEKNAKLIVTDSGGVQKEAFFYKVPCVTLRDETEWVELLALGWNRLVHPESAEHISECVMHAMGTKGQSGSPYGDGKAANIIVDSLFERL